MVMEPNSPGGVQDPRAGGDTPAEKALAPKLIEVQDSGLPQGAIPGGLTAEGFAKMQSRMSPGGDYFIDWEKQLQDSPNGCISIQTGFSALDNLVIQVMEEAGHTAGWNGGQVLVGKDSLSYFNALDDVARNRLALLLTHQA